MVSRRSSSGDVLDLLRCHFQPHRCPGLRWSIRSPAANGSSCCSPSSDTACACPFGLVGLQTHRFPGQRHHFDQGMRSIRGLVDWWRKRTRRSWGFANAGSHVRSRSVDDDRRNSRDVFRGGHRMRHRDERQRSRGFWSENVRAEDSEAVGSKGLARMGRLVFLERRTSLGYAPSTRACF
jgi:hypothetical protein